MTILYMTRLALAGLLLFPSTIVVALDAPNPGPSPSSEAIAEAIRDHVHTMTVPELLGQKLIVGLPWTTTAEAATGDETLSTLLTSHKIGNLFVSDRVYRDWLALTRGVALEGSRPSMDYVVRHIATIRTLMRDRGIPIPPIVATDYEGGRVQHLRHRDIGPSQTPSPMAFAFAARDDLDEIHLFGALIGEQLRHLGFTTNFAPLVDLATVTSAPVIGTRSYGSSESTVQLMATEFANGLVSQGIAPVLKHWPGLGGVYPANDDWNENLDVHDFRSPMRLKLPISDYNFLYKSILSKEPLSHLAAVMSAHVLSPEHSSICPDGRRIVSTCRQLVQQKFRDELGQHNRVLISDDLAYLRAFYDQMEGKSHQLARLLDNIFQSGHDIAIVGSPVPRRSNLRCSGTATNNFGCDPLFLPSALDSLYDEYENTARTQKDLLIQLRRSVERILRWKYDIYANLVPTLTPTTFFDSTTVYVPSPRRSPDIVSKELKELSEEVFAKAISIVARPQSSSHPDRSKKLGLKKFGKVLCVGPTYRTNDLEAALEDKAIADKIDCVDLGYDDAARRDDGFVDSKSNEIERYLDSASRGEAYDVLIFGLADIPKHQQVAKRTKELLEGQQAVESVVWVAFDSPTVLNRTFFRDGDYAVATFSNSGLSNRVLIDVLFGNTNASGPEKSPVEIPILKGNGGGFSAYATEIYASLGAVFAVLVLGCVRPKGREAKRWWAISILSGCSGLVLSFAGTVVEIRPWELETPGVGPLLVMLGDGTRFVTPLVLTFVSFGFINLLVRALALKEAAQGKRDDAD